MAPASVARRTSRDSRSASFVISSGDKVLPSRTPALITRRGCALAKSRRPLAASTGSPVMKAMADEGRDTGLLGGALRERVLDHGVGGVFPDRAAQLRELGHGQTAVLGENGRTGLTELVRDLGNGCALLGVCHLGLLPLRGAARRRGPEGLHEKSPGAG